MQYISTRKATIEDLSFLAQIEYEASLPPANHCFWEDLLPAETSALQFITAQLRVNGSNWGDVEDFVVVELAGKPVAAAAGYVPSDDDYRPLKLSKLGAIAQELNWSPGVAEAFRDRYEQFLGSDRHPTFLTPQASWIVESVAVLPEARGKGLSKILLNAVLAEGRSHQHSHAGIMFINGNEVARHTYESVGFKPYQTFHADYFKYEFDLEFPGITKLGLLL